MTLGNKIYQERKAKGFSQEELAAQIGVSRQTIYKWENDQAMPDLSNLKKLSAVFNLSIEQLMEDRPSIQPDPVNDSIDRAIDTGARVVKKHWRKSGYLLIYWGIGLTLFGFIGSWMMGFFISSTNDMMGFGGLGLGDSFTHQSGIFSAFEMFPKLFLFIGLGLLAVGGFLVFSDYQKNHKN